MLLTAVITEAEEGGFIALNPETGTTTQGETYQEAIQNLIKHAQATEVNVCFKSDDRFLYIYIKDNGIGFNIKTVQRGSGLYNLQQRAQSLRGQCTLLSRPGHGTHIHLQIPK